MNQVRHFYQNGQLGNESHKLFTYVKHGWPLALTPVRYCSSCDDGVTLRQPPGGACGAWATRQEDGQVPAASRASRPQKTKQRPGDSTCGARGPGPAVSASGSVSSDPHPPTLVAWETALGKLRPFLMSAFAQVTLDALYSSGLLGAPLFELRPALPARLTAGQRPVPVCHTPPSAEGRKPLLLK